MKSSAVFSVSEYLTPFSAFLMPKSGSDGDSLENLRTYDRIKHVV
jgi:hypothetical protein